MNLFDIIPCWLIPLLVGALCAYFGYLLGKNKSDDNNNSNDIIAKLETDLETCKKARLALQADLDACNQSKLTLESDLKVAKESNTGNTNFAASLAGATTVASIPFNADAAKAVFGKKIKQDDLKIVEGIGPKIEQLFQSFGISTWKALGETSIEKCQEVLDSGGERYKIHKPNTWPKQAQMAYEGKWEELLKWQDELDGGKA
ncbi:hypothetical protein [Tenacibaculum sp. 190524A02b]|uniref:Flap endonuclease-1-like 5' DNA nuclease n=1 Tax=Tenacibaculum vairaonense TaxID=3137860 RepID=A0ABM9PQS7_9FLAO